MDGVLELDFDIFKLKDDSKGQELLCLMEHVFTKYDLLSKWDFPKSSFMEFTRSI